MHERTVGVSAVKIPPDLARQCLSMATNTSSVPLPANASEEELLARVLQIAQERGWRTFHQRPSRTAKGWCSAVQGDGKGYPDVMAVRGSRILFAELKSARGVPTVEQAAWLDALAGVAEVYVWRPKDIQEIMRVLE